MQGFLRPEIIEIPALDALKTDVSDSMQDIAFSGKEASIKSQKMENPDAVISFCFDCGARVIAGDGFCGKCGQAIRSKESLARITRGLQKQKEQNDLLLRQADDGNPIAIMESEDIDEAIAAMTKEYYVGNKAKISTDGAKLLQALYQPYVIPFSNIKRHSADGKRVRALGIALDMLEGWLGMVKAYNLFGKADPAHLENLAELWVGIGEWAK